jgi:cell division septation protein DedD
VARARSRGGARRWLAGLGLLGFGAVIGVMLGAILDGPRMFVRRWTEEVKVLEIARPSVDAPALEEYASLQERPDPAPEPPKKVQKRVEEKAKPPAPEPAVEKTPEPPEPPRKQAEPRPKATPSPEALIAELQRKRDALADAPAKPEPKPKPEPVPTGAGRSGAAVQVAAYRDVGAAETLVRRLRRAGYDAYLSDQRASGPNKYRVRVQPAAGASAKALASKLEDRGYGVWITRE